MLLLLTRYIRNTLLRFVLNFKFSCKGASYIPNRYPTTNIFIIINNTNKFKNFVSSWYENSTIYRLVNPFRLLRTVALLN